MDYCECASLIYVKAFLLRFLEQLSQPLHFQPYTSVNVLAKPEKKLLLASYNGSV